MRRFVLFCGVVLALGAGCDSAASSDEGPTKGNKNEKSTEPHKPGRPGLALPRKRGTPIEIGELTARPSIRLLADVDDVRLPGEAGETQNALEVQFTVEVNKKVPKRGALIVRNACQFLEHVIVDEREALLRPEGESDGVRLRKLKKGSRARGSTTSRPTAPELLAAKACEVTFIYTAGDAKTKLGKVCATGGTRIKRRPCSADELKRPKPQSDPVTVREPVGRVAHEGAAAWTLLTVHGEVGDAHPVSTIRCKDGQSATVDEEHDDTSLSHLQPGESVMIAFGMSKKKWLTREQGRCQISISATNRIGLLGTWCLVQGRTSAGNCTW